MASLAELKWKSRGSVVKVQLFRIRLGHESNALGNLASTNLNNERNIEMHSKRI